MKNVFTLTKKGLEMRVLFALMVALPMLLGTLGCGGAPDPATKPGFNKEAADPSKVAPMPVPKADPRKMAK